ncbi:thiazole biosynthesis protein [Candidatus Bathyarchaeota archaeon]|nr:MAG: thiazole biosynthesis protein [Candidatus Bathyarchaeota archaeon]
MFRELVNSYTEGDLAEILVDAALKRISSYSKTDVIIVGAGPAGLSAAWDLSKKGLKVLILEKMLGVGGGIRGGAMLLPAVIIEEGEATDMLREAKVNLVKYAEGLFCADPAEAMVKLAAKALEAGASVWPGVMVEDLIISRKRRSVNVRGVVINFTPITEAEWHVDPLFLESRVVVDATGHDADVVRILSKRCPWLNMSVQGMSSLDVWRGEEEVVEYTGKVVNGLYATGISVSEIHNLHRMGPMLGGMLLSGKKVAEKIVQEVFKE